MTAEEVEYIGRAPGKVILFGEHAVVYGKRAVAASVGLHTTARARRTGDHTLRVILSAFEVDHQWNLAEVVNTAELHTTNCHEAVEPSEVILEVIRELQSGFTHDSEKVNQALNALLFLVLSILGPQLQHGLELKIYSKLPVGAGLGSSASFSVAVSSSLLALSGALPASAKLSHQDKELVNMWAFEAERIIHGNPSGVDNTVVTYGGCLGYTKDDGREVFEEFPAVSFLITNTKVEKNTRKLVAGVRTRKDEKPAILDPIIDSIGGVSDSFIEQVRAIQINSGENALDYFIDLMASLISVNQHLLNAIGVGHSVIDDVCSVCNPMGLPTKLTGAGGGGCTVTLIPNGKQDEANKAMTELISRGYECYEVPIGGCGVSVERSDIQFECSSDLQAKN